MNHENKNAETITPQDIESEVIRHTASLEDRVEQDDAGVEEKHQLTKRIGEITANIVNNPDRVAFDINQREQGNPGEITIHDPAKAQMVAEVIKDDMDYITKHKNRSGLLQRVTQGRRDRAELNSRVWGKRAGDVYNNDPYGARPQTVELERIQASETLLGYSKSQLPRKK